MQSAPRGARSAPARSIFAIAGGVESMTRAPFVMGKAPEAFSRSADIYDTTSAACHQPADEGRNMASTRCPRPARNVAEEFQVSRARSGRRSRSARSSSPGKRLRRASSPRRYAGIGTRRQGRPHQRRQGRASAPRNHARRAFKTEADRAQSPARSRPAMPPASMTVPAAMILASEAAVKRHGLTPRAKILGLASAAVPPRIHWASARCRRRAS